MFPIFNFTGDYILANDNNQNLAMAGDIVGAIVNILIDFIGVFVFHVYYSACDNYRYCRSN